MEKINLKSSKVLGIIAVILGIIGSMLVYLFLSSILEMSLITPTAIFIVASILVLIAMNDISKKSRRTEDFLELSYRVYLCNFKCDSSFGFCR